MEQHPVPQNVTTFQFRLVGDMTLKQFGYLAGGAIAGYISLKLPLPIFFTWPIASLFFFGGIGFAFVPIEERPMDVWVLSFLKSIYSPTQYIWRRASTSVPQPQMAQAPPPPPPPPEKPSPQLSQLQKQLDGLLADRKKMEEELTSLRQKLSESQAKLPQAPPPPEAPQEPTIKAISPESAMKAGLPRITTFPNVTTGIIKDPQGNLLPGILVTVRDRDGVPLRALKTNKLGQFAASTPLPPGTYVIEVEDPRARFTFDRAQIVVNNTILPTLEIIAKSQKVLERQKLAQQIFGNKE